MTRMNTDLNQSARTFIVSTPEDVEKKHTSAFNPSPCPVGFQSITWNKKAEEQLPAPLELQPDSTGVGMKISWLNLLSLRSPIVRR
jgi:hypothetical protein